MKDSEIKGLIIEYIREYYGQNQVVPSLRKITQHFKKEKLNFTRFYRVFPGRMLEVCRLAAVPIPTERFRRTEKATLASKMKAKPDSHMETFPNRLVLSETQTKRLLGISHLESGKDPLIVLDELLDCDTKLRRKYKLKLSQIKRVEDFLKASAEKRLRAHEVLSILIRLQSSEFMDLDGQALKWLASLLEKAARDGIEVEEIMQTFERTKTDREKDICEAYDLGVDDGMKAFESAYTKSITDMAKDYQTLMWLYKIGDIAKMQALVDRNRH